MKKSNITIGTFCQDMHIRPSTLRYYESLGLIRPETIDEKNGYHYYSDAQYSTVEILQIFRKLKFPLKRIRLLQKSKDIRELLRMVKTERDLTRQSLREQQEICQNLSWLYETLEEAVALQDGKLTEIVCQKRPARSVFMVRPQKGQSDSWEQTDAALQGQLSRIISAKQFSANFVRRIYGYQLNLDSFLQNQLSLQGKFVELPQSPSDADSRMETIPAGEYLILPVQAFTDTQWLSRIREYAKASHFRIQEIYLTEVTLHLIPRSDAFYEAQALVETE